MGSKTIKCPECGGSGFMDAVLCHGDIIIEIFKKEVICIKCKGKGIYNDRITRNN